MKTLSQTLLELIHSDAIEDAFVALLHFSLSDSTELYYANYSEDVTFGGQVYTAWPCEGDLRVSGLGSQIPTVMLTLDDATRELRPYALRTNWFQDSTLTLTIASVANLTESYTWSEVVYDILHAVPQEDESVELKLGGPNISKLPYPAEHYSASQCIYADGFKNDPRCGYDGVETTCSGSITDCEDRSNVTRWGGWLGLDPDSANIVIPLRYGR